MQLPWDRANDEGVEKRRAGGAGGMIMMGQRRRSGLSSQEGKGKRKLVIRK